jgi:hypothetical protein
MAYQMKNWNPILNDETGLPDGLIAQIDVPIDMCDFKRRVESSSTGYGLKIASDWFFTNVLSGKKSYMLYLGGERQDIYPTTESDVDDAYMRISGSNYAANQANYIFRGINQAVNNRSGGIVGELCGIMGSATNYSGATATTVRAGQFTCRSNNTGSTEVEVLDLFLSHQAADSPTTFTILRLRNNDETGNVPIGSAIDIDDSHANAKGFNFLIDASGAGLTPRTGNIVCLFSFQDSAGTVNYVLHDADSATAIYVSTTLPAAS